MTTTNTGKNVIKALQAFQEFGRMTAQEFADIADITRYDAHAVLNRMSKRTMAGEKRIHIADWVYAHDDARRYPRPVFALGDRLDKPRPKADIKANKRRHDAKKHKMHRMNSVFNMGMTRDQVREISRATGRQLAA
jgi:hypothetical protein